jgi:hypothetical protein
MKVGDRVFSHRHRRGEILVASVRAAGALGRILRRDGTPSAAEVVLYPGDVRELRLALPGLPGGTHG